MAVMVTLLSRHRVPLARRSGSYLEDPGGDRLETAAASGDIEGLDEDVSGPRRLEIASIQSRAAA